MGFLLLLLYMVLLGFGAMISPGVGFFGGIVMMLPYATPDWLHAPAYGLLTWLLTNGFCRRGWPLRYALSTAMAGAMVFGIWMEVFQGLVPGRFLSIDDVVMNAVGVGTASVLLLWQGTGNAREQSSV